MDKAKLKKELIDLLGRWWNGGSKDGSPYLGERSLELMAEAVLTVLFAIADIQEFFEQEKMLR